MWQLDFLKLSGPAAMPGIGVGITIYLAGFLSGNRRFPQLFVASAQQLLPHCNGGGLPRLVRSGKKPNLTGA
jgi:hypothetical protein